jgi:hypothetical protein
VKKFLTLDTKKIRAAIALIALLFLALVADTQVSLVCTNPTNVAYGLTGNGEIYEINSITGATIRVIKNNTYAGLSPSSSNGLGFDVFNTRFYYFKRNISSGSQQFVSFAPATNTVTVLAPSTCTDDIHTGCVSFDGSGYYTVDIQGTLHYYDIVNNKWTFSSFSHPNKPISRLRRREIWLLMDWKHVASAHERIIMVSINFPPTYHCTGSTSYGGTLHRPDAVTPTGNSFAGIAFKPNGQILMATKSDNKLYLLQTSSTLTFVGNFTTSDVGNDLTACAFPAGILPVTWKSFGARVENNTHVVLNWEVLIEYANKGFYVQHSQNGKDWEDVAFIAAKNMTQ